MTAAEAGAAPPDAGAGPIGATIDGGPMEVVRIAVPADPSYLSLLRSAAASLGARLDLTLDEIDDLRIAVDEAGALLLPRADPGSPLRCVFGIGVDELTVAVAVRCVDAGPLSAPSFAWTVLQALAGPVEVSTEGGEIRLLLRKSRQERT